MRMHTGTPCVYDIEAQRAEKARILFYEGW